MLHLQVAAASRLPCCAPCRVAWPSPEADGGNLCGLSPCQLLVGGEEHPLPQCVLLQAPDVGAGVVCVGCDDVGPVALPHLQAGRGGRSRQGQGGRAMSGGLVEGRQEVFVPRGEAGRQ